MLSNNSSLFQIYPEFINITMTLIQPDLCINPPSRSLASTPKSATTKELGGREN